MNLFYIKNGINQNDASTYSIKKLYFEQADKQANEQADEQADEMANEHIITKLNILFNYIYKNECGKEIGLSEMDRKPLIVIFKRLERFVNNFEVYDFMPSSRLMDEKIMMWSIKEIYLSPYKIYLNELKKDKFELKYYKTKKYITEKSQYRLEEIISYFIACLQNDFENEK